MWALWPTAQQDLTDITEDLLFGIKCLINHCLHHYKFAPFRFISYMYVYLETSTVEHFHMALKKVFSVSCPSLYSHLHHTLPFPAPALRFSSLLGSKSKFKEAVLFVKVNRKEGRIYMRRVYMWISIYGLGGMTHGMWCILSCILRKKWVLHTCCMELDNIKNAIYFTFHTWDFLLLPLQTVPL